MLKSKKLDPAQTGPDLKKEVFNSLGAKPSLVERLELECSKALLESAAQRDPSHDIFHSQRVHQNQKIISLNEGGDQLILTPAAFLHDYICYPKGSEQSSRSRLESADFASSLLAKLDWYPQKKIEGVAQAISTCSFSAKLAPRSLEAAILQDADLLESCGVIGLMRTFASAGSLGRILFHPEDPFCHSRSPDPSRFAFDLVYSRLLKIEERLNTDGGKIMAHRRMESLREFITSWHSEQDLDLTLSLKLEQAHETCSPGKKVHYNYNPKLFEADDY